MLEANLSLPSRYHVTRHLPPRALTKPIYPGKVVTGLLFQQNPSIVPNHQQPNSTLIRPYPLALWAPAADPVAILTFSELAVESAT